MVDRAQSVAVVVTGLWMDVVGEAVIGKALPAS